MIKLTIKFWHPDEGGVKKDYHFINKEQKQWFMKGVEEAEGWMKYEATEFLYEELPSEKENKPEPDKLYALTGGPGSKCIANGNTWAESVVGEEVKPDWSYRKNKDGFMGSENRIMKK